MSQKNAKRLRQLDRRLTVLEQADHHMEQRWNIAEASAKVDTQAAAECRAQRRRAYQAERDVSMWRRVAFGALGAAIVVEIIAVATIWAKADKPTPEDGPTVLAVAEIIEEVPEESENELIEAALLARAVRLDDVTVTHYDTCVECCGGKADGITASGLQAVSGVTVAVDPAVIPLGSDVLVDYGDGDLQYYRADDTGHGVDGNAIDLCVASHAEALELGRRTATVYYVPPED